MTRVDFYVVKASGDDARLAVAARLANKAVGRGHRVFINCSTAEQVAALDQLLWGFEPSSFVPHAVASADPDEQVVIGFEQSPASHDDVLINLAMTPANFFARFQRVAEIVTQEAEALSLLRDAWRHYRDRGYPLQKHELS